MATEHTLSADEDSEMRLKVLEKAIGVILFGQTNVFKVKNELTYSRTAIIHCGEVQMFFANISM